VARHQIAVLLADHAVNQHLSALVDQLTFEARMARAHNDANVLCLGARVLDPTTADEIVAAFFGTDFEAGRHARRVDKLAPGS
jgi:ribose 5-phosphate isomerase B